jgi:orotate phosphoribosyltransferase
METGAVEATESLAAARQDLARLLRDRSIRRGDFILSSGARADYYIDARLTTMAGNGQRLIGVLGLAALDHAGWQPDAVGGLTLGADPVAYAIAHAAALAGRQIDGFTVRKEAKQHGAGRQIEGGFRPGMSVVVVEDTITSGESVLRAIRILTEAGARVLGVLTVVDREEGGRARLESAGWKLQTLFTARELLDT